MALASALPRHGFPERLRQYWTAFSATLAGDIVATAVAIAGVAAIFLACSFALIWFAWLARMILHGVGR